MSIAAARQEREVARPVVRFGDFEFDHAAQELRRRGRPAPLEGRAMTLLTVLLERPGELVTRAEIVERLWGSDAFIDVESGINTAVRKLRVALRDRAEAPRFVRTVQGKGYRFVAPIAGDAATDRVSGSPSEAPPAPALRNRRWPLTLAGVAVAAVAALGLVLALAPRPAGRPRIEVAPLSAAGGGPQAQALASRIGDQVTGVLNESGVQTGPPPGWRLPSWGA